MISSITIAVSLLFVIAIGMIITSHIVREQGLKTAKEVIRLKSGPSHRQNK